VTDTDRLEITVGLFSRKPTPAEWAGHIMDNETHPDWDEATRAHYASSVMQDHGLTRAQAEAAAAQAYTERKR
jgi:hypothetical protein